MKPQWRHLDTRTSRLWHKPAQQDPLAPIDLTYGDKGYARFTEAIRGTSGSARHIISSTKIANRFFVTAEQAPKNEPLFSTFLTCLDANGKPDSSFNQRGMVEFNELITDFTYQRIGWVVEDDKGCLLVLLHPLDQSTTHLWRLMPDGKPDFTFGAGKGYIDSNTLLGPNALFENIADSASGYVASAWRHGEPFLEPIVIALTNEGMLRKDFAENGILVVANQLPDTSYEYPYSIAVISNGTKEERLILSVRLLKDFEYRSVTSAWTLQGERDLAFANNGYHWSDPEIFNYGLSVEDTSQRITLYGQKYSIDDERSQPVLYRLDYSGKAAAEFNDGRVAFFDIEGAWDSIAEVSGKLVGYGSFFTRGIAVCYGLDGKLDQTFVPPFGYGTFTPTLPEEGFYTNSYSMTFDSDNQRMLICGYDEDLGAGYIGPCVIAVSLTTT